MSDRESFTGVNDDGSDEEFFDAIDDDTSSPPRRSNTSRAASNPVLTPNDPSPSETTSKGSESPLDVRRSFEGRVPDPIPSPQLVSSIVAAPPSPSSAGNAENTFLPKPTENGRRNSNSSDLNYSDGSSSDSEIRSSLSRTSVTDRTNAPSSPPTAFHRRDPSSNDRTLTPTVIVTPDQDNHEGDSSIDEAELLKNMIKDLDSGQTVHIEDYLQVLQNQEPLTTFTTPRYPSDANIEPEELKESEERRRKFTFWTKKKGPDIKIPGVPGIGVVPVKTHKKNYKEMSALFKLQELRRHEGAVWVMQFSHDGRYLATGGQDSVVRVWQVNENVQSTVERRTSYSNAEESPREILVFNPIPYREYKGHKGDVIGLAWSKSSFLLSASMDTTVRLWHVTRGEQLSLFQHSDFVTAVAFHPQEDKIFLSGSFDKKLRIWNIPERRVVDWAQAPEFITACCFSPNGRMVIGGLYHGQCIFYLTEGLRYLTQVDCKNRRGHNAKGKKVTGMQFLQDGTQILISTNDSRFRLYQMEDYSCLGKFKGNENEQLQIKAELSPDANYIVCGSEDGCVYLWTTTNTYVPAINPRLTGHRKDRNDSYECFKAHDSIATTALFAPQFVRDQVKFDASRYSPAALGAKPSQAIHLPGSSAQGMILVSSGYSGEIRIFQNRGVPLKS
eukprot:GILJ01003225.1.p1 GENE.GILJ01003225.1~~GILJ01003225.1.p1  ORF type:complete len:671 (-),score=104.71 GILJ01003225.1:74-2086(-)